MHHGILCRARRRARTINGVLSAVQKAGMEALDRAIDERSLALALRGEVA